MPLRVKDRPPERQNPGAPGLERQKRPAKAGAKSRKKEALSEFRARQMSVARILDKMLGSWKKCDLDVWERRAYLLLVASVYERLLCGKREISTGELIALGKALAENRRVAARSPRENDSSPKAASRSRKKRSTDDLTEIVQQVYGTRLTAEPNKQNA